MSLLTRSDLLRKASLKAILAVSVLLLFLSASLSFALTGTGRHKLLLPDFSKSEEPRGQNSLIELSKKDFPAYTRQLVKDLARFSESSKRLEIMVRALTPRTDLFEKVAKSNGINTPAEIRRVQSFWANFLHHLANLETLAQKYHFSMTDLWRDGDKSAFEAHFLGVNAKMALLIQTSRLMRYLKSRPRLAALFDEQYPALDLPQGLLQAVAQSCIRPRNLVSLYTFHLTHLDDMRSFYRGKGKVPVAADTGKVLKVYYDYHQDLVDRILRRIAKDSMWYKFVLGKPLSDVLGKVIAPLQEEIFAWVGDTRVKHSNDYLIKADQLQPMQKVMQPGDLVVERRNWYLSNLFISGFWPHAAVFVGTPEMVEASLDTNPEVRNYFQAGNKPGLLNFLKVKYPAAYQSWSSPNPHDGKPNLILEAISEGVVFNSLPESCCADYVGVVRPRLPPLDLAKAIASAFALHGREYDFDFDFWSESDMVCTELVAKAFASERSKRGIRFPWSTAPTGKVVRANGVVEKFDREYGKPMQDLDFVYFLRGIEAERRAVVGTMQEFRRSHSWKGSMGGLTGPER